MYMYKTKNEMYLASLGKQVIFIFMYLVYMYVLYTFLLQLDLKEINNMTGSNLLKLNQWLLA